MNFEEQIMSKDQYPSIISPQNGGYCAYYSSNLLRNASSFENWGIFNNEVEKSPLLSPTLR